MVALSNYFEGGRRVGALLDCLRLVIAGSLSLQALRRDVSKPSNQTLHPPSARATGCRSALTQSGNRNDSL